MPKHFALELVFEGDRVSAQILPGFRLRAVSPQNLLRGVPTVLLGLAPVVVAAGEDTVEAIGVASKRRDVARVRMRLGLPAKQGKREDKCYWFGCHLLCKF